MMPKRIQRKRTKGWKMSYSVIYVGRPSNWGNPFDWKDYHSQFCTESKAKAEAVQDFRRWLDGDIKLWPGARHWIKSNVSRLRGFDLCCWCKLCEKHRDGKPFDEICLDCEPCHADVLLELANKEK
jgi:hypothetical protein